MCIRDSLGLAFLGRARGDGGLAGLLGWHGLTSPMKQQTRDAGTGIRTIRTQGQTATTRGHAQPEGLCTQHANSRHQNRYGGKTRSFKTNHALGKTQVCRRQDGWANIWSAVLAGKVAQSVTIGRKFVARAGAGGAAVALARKQVDYTRKTTPE